MFADRVRQLLSFYTSMDLAHVGACQVANVRQSFLIFDVGGRQKNGLRLRIRKKPPKSVQSEDLQERVCTSDMDEHAALVRDLRNLIREESASASCLKEHSSFGGYMNSILARLWVNDEGQDIAEYAVMLAVILVIVVGTMRIVGSNSKNAFSTVASSLQ